MKKYLSIIFGLFILLTIPFLVYGQENPVLIEIRAMVLNNKDSLALNYPKTVARFYATNNYQPAWVGNKNALQLFDCVSQYGLSYADYHPEEMLKEQITNAGKARFEIMLTDALISLVNHLHYGKLNPDFPASKTDEFQSNGFNAENVLLNAVQQNDFRSAILTAQPNSLAYKQLQDYLMQIKEDYPDDCKEVPAAEIRNIAINLERLRWASLEEGTKIHINIPSYTLKLSLPDSTYQFKVIVGKPATPTPTLSSAVSYFSTAPDWKIPRNILIKEMLPKARKDSNYFRNNQIALYDDQGNYIEPTLNNLSAILKNPNKYFARQSSGCDNSLGLIVFRFPNNFSVYLHDTPEKQFFKIKLRALSHGCIRVEEPEKLASLLLQNDGSKNQIPALHEAIATYKKKNFTLRKSVPIIITYLTTEIKNGTLIKYNDLYNQDKRLENTLFNIQ